MPEHVTFGFLGQTRKTASRSKRYPHRIGCLFGLGASVPGFTRGKSLQVQNTEGLKSGAQTSCSQASEWELLGSTAKTVRIKSKRGSTHHRVVGGGGGGWGGKGDHVCIYIYIDTYICIYMQVYTQPRTITGELRAPPQQSLVILMVCHS